MKFPQSNANVAVIGASGGIGAAFVRQLALHCRDGSVFAFSRSMPGENMPGVTQQSIDVTQEDSVRRASELASAVGPLDLVIVASGVLHRGDELVPDKSLRQFDPEKLIEVMRVNTVGPALVAKHFLPKLRRDRKTVFAALSARVGSINDNRLGGWASYRSSKAALNMLLRTFAIEHARKCPESVVAALHPGTVDTALSKPFTSGTPEHRLFTADHSAACLLNVIDHLVPANSGGFYAWDGSPIEF